MPTPVSSGRMCSRGAKRCGHCDFTRTYSRALGVWFGQQITGVDYMATGSGSRVAGMGVGRMVSAVQYLKRFCIGTLYGVCALLLVKVVCTSERTREWRMST